MGLGMNHLGRDFLGLKKQNSPGAVVVKGGKDVVTVWTGRVLAGQRRGDELSRRLRSQRNCGSKTVRAHDG